MDHDPQGKNWYIKGSDDGTDLTYGVGAQFRVWSLSVRGEYERFDISNADTVDMFSIGVTSTSSTPRGRIWRTARLLRVCCSTKVGNTDRICMWQPSPNSSAC